MNEKICKVGLGGSCHWCTEAIFVSLSGVQKVEQGWLSSYGEDDWFSEGVIVYFNHDKIEISDLIEIHLHTHSCTSDHSMRHKYRSAIYTYSEKQSLDANIAIKTFQSDFDKKVITKILPFNAFQLSREGIQNYYYSNPEKPFCQTMINPKLIKILNKFRTKVNLDKIPSEVINSN